MEDRRISAPGEKIQVTHKTSRPCRKGPPQAQPGASKGPNSCVTHNLTPRQLQICELITVEELADKEIADRLKITRSAVRKHLVRLFKVLKCRTRAGLAAAYGKWEASKQIADLEMQVVRARGRAHLHQLYRFEGKIGSLEKFAILTREIGRIKMETLINTPDGQATFPERFEQLQLQLRSTAMGLAVEKYPIEYKAYMDAGGGRL